MGLALVLVWLWLMRHSTIKPLPRQSWNARLKATGRGIWALGMPVIILGGIRLGVVTPTEAAVVAAVYALLVGMLVYRELKIHQLYGVVLQAGKTSAIIMFLVAAAMVVGRLITAADIPGEITAVIEPLI